MEGRRREFGVRLKRRYITWWRRQSPARQDRFATLGPLISVMLFLAAIIAAFWYLRNEESQRETEAVKRDTEIAQQQIRLHLIENQEQLVRIARELVTRSLNTQQFVTQAASFARENPEITQIIWVNARRERRVGVSAPSFDPDATPTGANAPDPSMPSAGSGLPSEIAFTNARDRRLPIYSPPFADLSGSNVFQIHIAPLDLMKRPNR